MQVTFQYTDGKCVRMEQVYADILQRISKGTIVDEVIPADVVPAATTVPVVNAAPASRGPARKRRGNRGAR